MYVQVLKRFWFNTQCVHYTARRLILALINSAISSVYPDLQVCYTGLLNDCEFLKAFSEDFFQNVVGSLKSWVLLLSVTINSVSVCGWPLMIPEESLNCKNGEMHTEKLTVRSFEESWKMLLMLMQITRYWCLLPSTYSICATNPLFC